MAEDQPTLFPDDGQERNCRLCKAILTNAKYKACSECRAKSAQLSKEQRQKRVANGLCMGCGNNDALRPGLKICDDCMCKHKTRRQKKSSDRICSQCQVNIVKKHRQICAVCFRDNLVKHRVGGSKKSGDKAQLQGLCRICHKKEPTGDLRICSECKERARIKQQSKKRQAFAIYGGRCACCGATELSWLSFDHKNNDGAEQRRKGMPCGVNLYLAIISGRLRPTDLEVCCMSCQWGRRLNNGVCPCQTKLIVRGDGEGI